MHLAGTMIGRVVRCSTRGFVGAMPDKVKSSD
jgi:hypothetical protein